MLAALHIRFAAVGPGGRCRCLKVLMDRRKLIRYATSRGIVTVRTPASASRIWVSRLAVGAAIGALCGAVLGGVAFSVLGTDSTATSLVRLTPPPELMAIATGADRSTPDTDVYISQYMTGEVAYLSGIGFTRAVGASLGQSGPAQIDVLQEIGSSVVVFTGKADSDADAIRTVQAAIDVYRAQIAQRSERQLRPILPALDEWEEEATGAGDFPRVRQIRELRESLRLQAGTPASVTVLQPPTVDEAMVDKWMLGAALGALIGGTAVPLAQMARRRKSGYLTSAAEISDTVDGVIVPAVDLRQAVPRSRSKKLVMLARTLYAQCPSPGPARTIVLIGASPSSGTSIIASLFERAAAETGPVRAIRLRDEATPSIHSADGDSTLVIDAGAIGDSWLIEEAIRQATDLIVVARLGVDTAQQVFMVRSATAASEVPLAAVVTFRPWRGFSRSDGAVARDADGAARTDGGGSPMTTSGSSHQ